MKVSVLSSGSSGNAILGSSSWASILVDVGLGIKALEQRLHDVGHRASELFTAVYTHNHGDHVKGAGPLATKYAVSSRLMMPTENEQVIGGLHIASFPV